MSNLYDRITEKAAEKGLSNYALCQQAGVTRSRMTDLKTGRVKTLSSEVLRRMAIVLGTTVEYLLYGEEGEDVLRIKPEDKRVSFRELCERLDNGQLLSLLNAATVELQRRQNKTEE